MDKKRSTMLTNSKHKNAGVVIIMLAKIDIKIEVLQRQRCFIMTKKSIHQEYLTIMHVHAPNDRATKYMKEKLTNLKEENDNSTLIAGF